MEILARPADGRVIDFGDFADVTTVPVTEIEWAEGRQIRIVFDGNLSAIEQQKVRLRITSSDAAEEQMRLALAAYLTSSSPTIDQTNNTLKRLIRLVLSLSE